MRIKEVMTRAVEVVNADVTVQEAAARMKSLNVGSIPVSEGGRPIGIVTDRDIVIRAVSEGLDARTTRVQEVMSGDVATCNEDDDVKEAARVMKDRQIRRLVVVGADKGVAGILSLGDIAVDARDDKMTGQVLEKVSQDTATVGARR